MKLLPVILICARYGGEDRSDSANIDEKGAKVKAEEIRDAIESLGTEYSKSTVSPVITASLALQRSISLITTTGR